MIEKKERKITKVVSFENMERDSLHMQKYTTVYLLHYIRYIIIQNLYFLIKIKPKQPEHTTKRIAELSKGH